MYSCSPSSGACDDGYDGCAPFRSHGDTRCLLRAAGREDPRHRRACLAALRRRVRAGARALCKGLVRARPGLEGGELMSNADSSVVPPAGATESAKLHRRALGVPGLMFFFIAASAPLTAVAGGPAATFPVSGNKG